MCVVLLLVTLFCHVGRRNSIANLRMRWYLPAACCVLKILFVLMRARSLIINDKIEAYVRLFSLHVASGRCISSLSASLTRWESTMNPDWA